MIAGRELCGDLLTYEEIDIGKPEPGEVCVRNRAIGVNFVYNYLRSGVFPPPRMALYQHSITMPRQPHSKACCL